MGLMKEFREFALKGNVVDLAVGVIIGAAFGKIVASVVEDLIMPPIGKLVGNVDFSNLYISLSDKVDAKNAELMQAVAATQPSADGAMSALSTVGRMPLAQAKTFGPVIAYGNFITILINFLIVAFCIFMIVKLINMARRKPDPAPAAPPAPTREETLLMEIRDALKANR